MPPRQVLLLGMPELLRDLVRDTVAREEDLEIVAEVADAASVPAEVEPDFVLVSGAEAVDDADLLDLLERRPRARVLSVRGDGRDALLWELRPRRIPLGEISPAVLLAAIRAPDWRHAGVG